MTTCLESKIRASIILVASCLGAIPAYGYVKVQRGSDLVVSGSVHIGSQLRGIGEYDPVDVMRDMEVGADLDVSGDLEVWSWIGPWSRPYGFFDYLTVDNQINTGHIAVYGNAGVIGDLTVFGKTDCLGGLDPAYLLLDVQQRQTVIEQVQREVAPQKQGGAALFFNKDAHQLEVYLPSEGKFYDLNGAVVHTLPAIAAPTTQRKAAYYLDGSTGQVKSWAKPIRNRYQVKSGYHVDEGTGQFINERSGQAVTREEAIEFYNASEHTYYDLDGRPVRKDPTQQQVECVTEYRFDRHTGQVYQVRRPIRELYTLKEGFHFDKNSGKFIETTTGNAVSAQDALQLTKR